MKFLLLFFIFFAPSAFADETSTGFFEGQLKLDPSGCQKTRDCKVAYKLRYTDPNSLVWQADAENITDGASIPFWAQPVIGDPYDETFIKAAVIHDHYCEEQHRVRTWYETHKIFYYALLNQGVEDGKAKLMYLAVLIGGPKWRTVITGRDCGKNCTNANKVRTEITRPVMNKDISRQKGFEEIQKIMISKNGNLSLSEIEALAKKQFPEDDFLHNPSLIDLTTSVTSSNSQ
jgi:hypothetical protein